MTAPTCALCGNGLNNTSHKLQFLRLAYTEFPERDVRKYLIRIAVNCYTVFKHYKKWVPLDTLMEQIMADEVGGRNIDRDPENEMADVLLHLGGRPLIKWDARLENEEFPTGVPDSIEAIV